MQNTIPKYRRVLLKLSGEAEKLGAISAISRQGMSVARTEEYIERLLE